MYNNFLSSYSGLVSLSLSIWLTPIESCQIDVYVASGPSGNDPSKLQDKYEKAPV